MCTYQRETPAQALATGLRPRRELLCADTYCSGCLPRPWAVLVLVEDQTVKAATLSSCQTPMHARHALQRPPARAHITGSPTFCCPRMPNRNHGLERKREVLGYYFYCWIQPSRFFLVFCIAGLPCYYLTENVVEVNFPLFLSHALFILVEVCGMEPFSMAKTFPELGCEVD